MNIYIYITFVFYVGGRATNFCLPIPREGLLLNVVATLAILSRKYFKILITTLLILNEHSVICFLIAIYRSFDETYRTKQYIILNIYTKAFEH